MVLFCILAVILVVLVVLAVLALAFGGTVGFLLCADLIVCIAIIAYLMKLLSKKR